MSIESQVLGPIAAVLASVGWVIGSQAYSEISKTHGFLSLNVTRSALGSVLCATTLLFFFPKESLDFLSAGHFPLISILWLGISVLASVVVGDSLFFWATTRIGLSNTQTIAATYPLWAALMGWYWLEKNLSWTALTGILISVMAIGTLTLQKPQNEGISKLIDPHSKEIPTSRFKYLGIASAICASIFWALNTFATRQGASELLPVAANLMRMNLCFGVSALAFASKQFFVLNKTQFFLPKKTFKKYFWPMFAECYLGSLCFVYGISKSELHTGALLTSLAPILTIPYLVFQKKEAFSFKKLILALLVVAGTMLVLWD